MEMSFIAGLLVFTVSASGGSRSDPLVRVAQGVLRGFVDPATSKWMQFRGVPFAQPPVGPLRWRPPMPPLKYTEPVRNATVFGHTCTQPGSVYDNVTHGLWPSIGGVGEAQEDCLTLNIVAPIEVPLPPLAPLPVVLYIPSGEFHYGAANDLENNFPGFASLHEPDIIYVTTNYRVGIFGFLASEDLRRLDDGSSEVSEGGSSGNYGLQDQRAAMIWVRDNIAAFGGDPNKITIWGESSGASSVAMHLAYRRSWGLFASAAMDSADLVEVKPWRDAIAQHGYLLSLMAFTRRVGSGADASIFGQDCQLVNVSAAPGGTEGAFIEVHNAAMVHAAVRSFPFHLHAGPPNGTLAEAMEWCVAQASCAGFVAPFDADSKPAPSARLKGLAYTIVPNGNAGLADVGTVVEHYKIVTNYVRNRTTYVRAPVLGQQGTACLAAQPTSTLAALNVDDLAILPYRDSFIGSTWAPAVDGIEADAPLETMIARRAANNATDPKVPVVIGFNRDEGSIFMGGLPGPLPKNATDDMLSWWAAQLWGSSGGERVLERYVDLVPPTPPLSPDPAGAGNSNYWRAVRAAGDWGMSCTARRAARAFAQGGHATFLYFFDHTPYWSINYGAGLNIGAYHGAEVPYVFNDVWELDHTPDGKRQLNSTKERDLASKMNCLFGNFFETGDPNLGGRCPVGLGWTQLTYAKDTGVWSNTSIHFGTADEGGVFVQTDLNGRQQKCDLFDTLRKPGNDA